jgi:hypothetical protein
MKQLNIQSKTKFEGLSEFQKRGSALVDATYEPVNALVVRGRDLVMGSIFSTRAVLFTFPATDARVISIGSSAKSCRDRAGSYRRDGLLAPFGADIALPDLLMALAPCERRRDFSKPRGARFTDPVGRR